MALKGIGEHISRRAVLSQDVKLLHIADQLVKILRSTRHVRRDSTLHESEDISDWVGAGHDAR